MPDPSKMPFLAPRRRLKASQAIPKKYTEIGAKRAALLKGMKYRTKNYMMATEKENKPDGVSRAVLDILDKFEKKYSKKWRGRHITRPADVARVVAWWYLTGSRKEEIFLKPYPRISISPRRRDMPWRTVNVTRVIEKSFANRATGERLIHEQKIPIFDSTEDKLWRKVLDDYEHLDLDDLFQRMSKHRKSLTSIIQHNFHCDMREESSGRLLENAPITPHAFRHHRAFNLYIQRELDDQYVTLLFGWSDSRMLGYYAYLNRASKGQKQEQLLKKYAAEHAKH